MPDALEVSPLVSIFVAPFELFVAFFPPSVVEAGFPDSTGLSVSVTKQSSTYRDVCSRKKEEKE